MSKKGSSKTTKKNTTTKKRSSSTARRKSKNNQRSLPEVQGIKVKSRRPDRKKQTQKVREPDWVRRIQKELPPYADEMLAFLLVGVGLLSFLTLLSPESGAVGALWSGTLRQWFGAGAYIISGAILVAGSLLLLPKIGIPVQVNWWRITFGELFFVLTLAYLHATIRAHVGGEAGRIEAFARAMEGRGGGIVGWALQDLFHMMLGDIITGMVLLSLLAITAALMAGIQREHLVDALNQAHGWALETAERLDPNPNPEPATVSAPASTRKKPTPVPKSKATDSAAAKSTPKSNSKKPSKPTKSSMPATTVLPASPLVPTSSIPESVTKEQQDKKPQVKPVPVELPPLPGRPSIVTGQRGAGAVAIQRPEKQEGNGKKDGRTFKKSDRPQTRMERLKAKMLDEEIEHRFTLEEVKYKRKVRKRDDEIPPLKLLDATKFERPDDEEINISAKIIEETVADFGMQVEVVGVKSGPTVTQYAVSPLTEIEKDGEKVVQRVRVTRVANLGNDLALALAAPSVRIQAPVPGTNYIGVEVPNAQPGIVSLRPVIESEEFYKIGKSPLAFALGREVDGTPIAADLGKMPHMLIGGTTGSGKSVCLRSIATCLVANNTPDELKMIMIDPKMVELVRFNGLPHLLGHVEVKLDRIIGVLRWITREMDRRYKLMEEAMARNIDVYNHGRRTENRLPRIVVLVDELAEMMMEYPDDTEHLITRLAQMARATGIHLIVATQRPSTDVVTGLIKANFPARIAFATATGVDSRVIIDSVGAQDLIGKGDMLYQSPEAAGPVRLQGCFVSDSEMENIVDFWVDNWKDDEDSLLPPWERALRRASILEETDEMLEEAVRLVQEEQEASASMIQRKLNVGYPRAGRIIDSLYRLGVVGPELSGGRTREVNIKPDDDPVDFIVRKSQEQKD